MARWWRVSACALMALAVLGVGAAPAQTDTSHTYVVFESSPHGSIGMAHPWWFNPPSATVTVAGSRQIAVVGVRTPSSYFDIILDAPGESQLTAGTTYAGAVRHPFNDGAPGISVSGNHNGCNQETGSFTIHELGFNGADQLVSLHATFEHFCEGNPLWWLQGEIAVNSTSAGREDIVLKQTVSESPNGGRVYTALVHNDSSEPSAPVTFTQPVPAGATLAAASASQGTCDAAGTCELGSIEAAGMAAVSIVLTPTANGTLNTHASVSTDAASNVETRNDAVDLSTVVSLTPPAGRLELVFRSLRDGIPQLYAATADGARQANMSGTANEDISATWSPDGSKLAFHRAVAGNTDIYTMNADGSGVVRVTTHAAVDEYPAWSPDGSKLVFDSDRAGNFDIYAMNTNGTGVTQLTHHPGHDDLGNYSPDGNLIAFDSERDGQPEIYLMDASGNNERNVTNHPADDLSRPTWSPDGQRLAFTSDRVGSVDVWLIDADGTDATRLTALASAVAANPAWSPDGTKVAFDTNWVSQRFEVYTVNVDGTGNYRRITNNMYTDTLPAWRPGASAVAPANTAAPAVVGNAFVGETLTRGSLGHWTGTAPVTLTSKWVRCNAGGGACVDTGSSGTGYTLGVLDTGTTIRLSVTASNAAGTATATSAPIGPVSEPPPGGGGGGAGAADLLLSGSVTPASAPERGTLSWRLRVTGKNPSLALGVYVDVALPAGVTVASSQTDRGPGCSVTGPQRLRCGLDFLSGAALTGDVVLNTTVAAAGELVLTATAGYVASDPTPADNSVTLRANTATTQPPPPPPPAVCRGLARAGSATSNRLVGTACPDTLRGMAGADSLLGLGGADRLFGGLGNDLLDGGAENDRLEGGSGNDRLYGRAGNDTLLGGTGVDTIDSGAGSDTILARDGARDMIRCGSGRDIVTADRVDRVAADCERVTRR